MVLVWIDAFKLAFGFCLGCVFGLLMDFALLMGLHVDDGGDVANGIFRASLCSFT